MIVKPISSSRDEIYQGAEIEVVGRKTARPSVGMKKRAKAHSLRPGAREKDTIYRNNNDGGEQRQECRSFVDRDQGHAPQAPP
jgi:hypothetical protein